jgi:hypothetical protein
VPCRLCCSSQCGEKEDDYVMLSDSTTGWHATELAGLKPGESVAIVWRGAGRFDGSSFGDH